MYYNTIFTFFCKYFKKRAIFIDIIKYIEYNVITKWIVTLSRQDPHITCFMMVLVFLFGGLMKIIRILNNNAVISHNENNEEIVVLGSGIAFKKQSNDEINETSIERIFHLKKHENKSKFYELISNIPMEYIKLSERIVNLAKSHLNCDLDESIYLLLTDHIHYAVERNRKGLMIRNKLIWEIEHFYPQEYQVGIEAINIINEKLKCNLVQAEAGFIAMHIVNTSSNEKIEEIHNEMVDIKSVIKLVMYHYNAKIKEDSMNYLRFITHLRFFIHRFKSNQHLKKIDQSDELFAMICKKYFNAYLCVEKIEKYFINSYQKEISDEEKMYLVLHIDRVMSNESIE